MAKRVDSKSVLLGAVLGGALCVLIGAAANPSSGPVGRFQIACMQNGAYLADTTTGQVWHHSEREFRAPKPRTGSVSEKPAAGHLSEPAAPVVQDRRTESRVRAGSAGFVGAWVLTHPTEGQLGIRIEPEGRAVLTEGNKSWDGKWRIEGNQITIVTEQETVTAQLDDQDRLLVKEGSSEPIAFKRAP
ncbi:MAG TPA: hypothetical protein PKH24_05400 [Sedimentisphaerales bacterium]|jgi:hypothetical protein|nr:hypothetical protein [Sedimentisphaerales bacterium]HNU29015.1 hypothetical protein [Sedimentisphaerales bacterium]